MTRVRRPSKPTALLPVVSAPVLSPSGGLLSTAPLHGGAVQTPVPHWVVLLVVVPALWLLVAAVVVAVDRLHRRFRPSRSAD